MRQYQYKIFYKYTKTSCVFIWKVKKKPLQYPQISDRLSVIAMDCHVISQLQFTHCYCFQLMWTYSFRVGQSRVITIYNDTTNRSSVFQIKIYLLVNNKYSTKMIPGTRWRFIKNKAGIHKCFTNTTIIILLEILILSHSILP